MTTEELEKRVEELAGLVNHLREKVDTMADGMVTMVTEVAPKYHDRKVTELAGQVEKLQQKVDTMAAGMVTMVTEVVPKAQAAEAAKISSKRKGEEDNIAAWAGSSALLPRISTLCFLLVVALALRTVTDSGIIDTFVGSVVGMMYAASLIVIGWTRYRKGSPIAPVFSLSGAILMFSIVLETHTHFGSLPTMPAYLLLLGTGVAMALTGRASPTATPLVIGILGMCFAGVALNFPVSSFGFLMILLFVANLTGYLSAPRQNRDWLRWTVFLMTAMVVQVWGVRLKVALLNPDLASAPLMPGWFIPSVAVFALFFPVSAFYGMLRSQGGGKRAFDYVVPAVSAVVFFTAARHVVMPFWGTGLGLGIAGALAATAHLGVASWMVRGKKLTTLEFNSFTFAAVVWLILSLSAATGALLAALPLLSVAAFHLATISSRWQSGGTRIISYLLQSFAAFTLSAIMIAMPAQVPTLLAVAASGTVGLVGYLHYRWCRRNKPPAESFVYVRFDEKDYLGVTLLLSSLAGWFFLLRIGIGQVLSASHGGSTIANTFSGSQSLIINAAAIGLLILSYLHRNREVRNVAIFVVLVGGAKVFFYDLVSVQGVARVLSVFSFGLVAAVASYILGRWQKTKPPSPEPPSAGGTEVSKAR